MSMNERNWQNGNWNEPLIPTEYSVKNLVLQKEERYQSCDTYILIWNTKIIFEALILFMHTSEFLSDVFLPKVYS